MLLRSSAPLSKASSTRSTQSVSNYRHAISTQFRHTTHKPIQPWRHQQRNLSTATTHSFKSSGLLHCTSTHHHRTKHSSPTVGLNATTRITSTGAHTNKIASAQKEDLPDSLLFAAAVAAAITVRTQHTAQALAHAIMLSMHLFSSRYMFIFSCSHASLSLGFVAAWLGRWRCERAVVFLRFAGKVRRVPLHARYTYTPTHTLIRFTCTRLCSSLFSFFCFFSSFLFLPSI